jgi:hypothetical protein
MPRHLGMSRRHKRGTGRNKNTTHKREIVACNNIGGRAGKASKVAPAEHNSRPDSQADSQASSSDFKVGPSPPGTVMSYVIYSKEVFFELGGKTLTDGSSSTTTKQTTRTIAAGNSSTTGTRTTTTDENGTINHETRTSAVEVLEHPIQLPKHIDAPKLNRNAFDQNASGKDQSVSASKKARWRSTKNIVDAILNSGTTAQQALALRSACLHPKMLSIAKTAGLLPIGSVLIEGVKNTFKEVLGTGKQKRVNADRSTFAEILSSAFAGITATNKDIASVLELDQNAAAKDC